MKRDMKSLIAEIKQLANPDIDHGPEWQPMEYWCEQFGTCPQVTARTIKIAVANGRMEARRLPIKALDGGVRKYMRYRLVTR